MKIGLIVIGAIAIVCVAFEVVGKIVAKGARARLDKMSHDEQRKEQERLYKEQQMG